MIYRGLAITGADTGVGKTTVACALARLFREAGLRVGVLKPVETGCVGEELLPLDGVKLATAAGIDVEQRDAATRWDDIVPWRFSAPLAPEAAARLAGVELTVDRIYQAMDRWMERADLVLIETAGGLLVPLNPRFTFADLLQGFELPVVVVAEDRLGVINQVLLTLEALRVRGLTPIGVVLCQRSAVADLSASSNAELIAAHGEVKVIAVPHAPETADAGSGSGPEAEATRALRPHFPELREAMAADWTRVAGKYTNRPGETGEY